jgi:hypothetical protein
MIERTAKMTESHRDVGVRGWSARSGPRWLDRCTAWTRGALVNAGCAQVNVGRTRGWLGRVRAIGSVADRLVGLGDGPIGPSP